MNNDQHNTAELRNPLFNPYIVERALLTMREITDQLLDVIGSCPTDLFGTQGKASFTLLVDLKINEITDELTLERLNR